MPSGIANYNGRQPNNTAYIKTFVPGVSPNLWRPLTYENIGTLTPLLPKFQSVLIPQNLYVEGNLYNPSDIRLKTNIKSIDETLSNKLFDLKPTEFTYKNDEKNKTHYGFIAQDMEKVFPDLVSEKPDEHTDDLLSVNYLELIPLLVSSIKEMKNEINELKSILIKNNISIK